MFPFCVHEHFVGSVLLRKYSSHCVSTMFSLFTGGKFNVRMMADDYADDLDALTSLLDEEENPYDDGEPLSFKSRDSECAKVSRTLKKKTAEKEKRAGSASSQDENDHEKSKDELISESPLEIPYLGIYVELWR